MTTVRVLTPIAVALLVGFFTCLLLAKPATTQPVVGFSDVKVTDVPLPTALAFTPDGRMLIASRSGKLRVYQDGALVPTPALDLKPDVCTNKERGLLGLAVDPQFGTAGNNYVYVYYTYKKLGVCPQDRPADKRNPVNRVSRFVLNGNNTMGREEILIRNIPSPNGNHNGGDLHFGNDDKLYVSVGDGGCDYSRPKLCQYENGAAHRRNVMLGKMLRIEPNGDVPPDNPFTGPNGGRCADDPDGRLASGKFCREIYASGFRNPFRFAVDPNSNRLFINDVGGQRWEEIDELDAATSDVEDYGWNLCEGLHDNPDRRGKVNCNGNNYTGPIHEYNHRTTKCGSITGGAFVPDDAVSWGEYTDSYLFGDFVCNKIFEIPDEGSGSQRTLFANVGDGGPVAMEFGPSDSGQVLYYTTFAQGGQVHRIEPVSP